MLKNRLYCGYIQTKDVCSPFIESIKIVDEDIFNMVQEILQQRATKNEKKLSVVKKNEGENLLSGNIFCGHCGGRMVSNIHQVEYKKLDNTVSIYHVRKYI